jgi:hypothetical protein
MEGSEKHCLEKRELVRILDDCRKNGQKRVQEALGNWLPWARCRALSLNADENFLKKEGGR